MSHAFAFRRGAAVVASVLAASLCLLLTGCIVVNKKDQNGKKQDNVSIVVPFAGIHVQTNQTSAADLGLSVYPGATVTRGNDNNQSANVDMGFGPWQLKVKVVSYKTPDSQPKVISYYRKQLGSFGTVIACDGDKPVGTPAVTGQGLTCSESGKHVNVNGNDAESGFTLRAGSPHHQRIVAFQDTGGNGTKFTLIELVLPDHSGHHATPD